MSIVNRAQFLETVTHSFPTATPLQTLDVPRPQTTPASPAYAEGVDHVTKLPSLDEDYAGEVIITTPSTLNLVTVFLRTVEVRKLLPTPQKGLTTPSSSSISFPPPVTGVLFPSGAATDSEHVRYLVNESGAGSGFPMNGDTAQAFLGMEVGNSPGRSYPGITLRAGEYVRLTFSNDSGGDLNSQLIEARYSMGQHQSDVGRP